MRPLSLLAKVPAIRPIIHRLPPFQAQTICPESGEALPNVSSVLRHP